VARASAEGAAAVSATVEHVEGRALSPAEQASLDAEISELGPPPRGFRWMMVAHVGPEPVAGEGCLVTWGWELRPLLRSLRW
jgi:hypothetical protein